MKDKEKILAEIERRYNQNNDKLTKIPEYCDETSILQRVCAEDLYFRDFINSLLTEMPSEDLKKAAEEYASMSQIAYKGIHCTYVDDQHAFIAGADWQKEKTINKAYQWLQHNAEKYVASYGLPNYQTGLLLNDFKHAMEDNQ